MESARMEVEEESEWLGWHIHCPSSLHIYFFECMAMEFYVLLIQVPIACTRCGKIIAKIENVHKKILLNSLEFMMTRPLAGRPTIQKLVGCVYFAMRNCNQG